MTDTKKILIEVAEYQFEQITNLYNDSVDVSVTLKPGFQVTLIIKQFQLIDKFKLFYKNSGGGK